MSKRNGWEALLVGVAVVLAFALGVTACDLKVTDIHYDRSGPFYAGQTKVGIRVTIKNIGSDQCGEPYNCPTYVWSPFYIRLWIDGREIDDFFQNYTPCSGKTRIYYLYGYTPPRSGRIKIVVMANPTGALAEARYTNNVREEYLTVEAPKAPEALPDLVPRNLLLNGSTSGTFTVGQEVKITCDVKNVGPGKAPSSRIRFYFSRLTSNTEARNKVDSEFVATLKPSASTSLEDEFTLGTEHVGRMYMTAMADEGELVPETNDRNNKIFIGPFTVEHPAVVARAGDDTAISCTRPLVRLHGSATGGVKPYTYAWNPGGEGQEIEVRSPGTYTLTVTDKRGKKDTDQVVVVGDQASPVVDAGEDQVIGSSGPVLLDAAVQAGSPEDTFRWSPGGETTEDIWVESPGTYTLTITGVNGCIAEASVEVKELDRVEFPDSVLDQAFRAQYGLADDDPIYPDDPRFTSLDARSKGIQDLSGLEKLPYIETVDLAYNRIRDLSPLRGLTNLHSLDLGSNLIWSITPLSENAGLGSGDTVNLLSNLLETDNDSSEDMVLIRWLEERGVQVLYTAQDPPLCGSNPPDLDGIRITINKPSSPLEISGVMLAYVAHGFCTVVDEPGQSMCEGYAFELYVDGERQPSEYLTTPLERHSYLEGHSCYWVSVFPPNSLAEGEHSFRGVWSCSDCNDGSPWSAERWRTVTVAYPDTDEPVVVGVSVSHQAIASADIGGELTATVHYSEAMLRDGTADPVCEFTPDVSSLLSLVSSAWFDADTFSATYEILDVELDEDHVTIVATGGRDEAGNLQLDHESDLAISIDTDPPWGTEPSGLDRFPEGGPLIVLIDSDVGEDTVKLTASFTEPMDTTVTPEVTFAPDVSANLRQSVSTWTGGDTQYVRIYDVIDLGVETDWVDVTVSGASDVAGNAWDVHWPDEFRIDTDNPEVISLTPEIAIPLVPEEPLRLSVTIEYSEAMNTDGGSDPMITFTAAVIPTLTETSGQWIRETAYVVEFEIDDPPLGQIGGSVRVDGAEDRAGNSQAEHIEEITLDLDPGCAGFSLRAAIEGSLIGTGYELTSDATPLVVTTNQEAEVAVTVDLPHGCSRELFSGVLAAGEHALGWSDVFGSRIDSLEGSVGISLSATSVSGCEAGYTLSARLEPPTAQRLAEMQNFRRSVPPARSSGRISVYAGQDVVIDGQDEHFTQHGVVDWPEACLGSQLRPCRDFSFTLQVDGVVVPSEPYFRQFPMYDGYEGQVCQWVCDFPPNNLSEGEHVFRGVWTCNGPDCPEGNNILEREITVTVLYEDEFSIRCPGDVIVCSGGAAIQPSRTGEPTVSGGYRDVSIEYEDEGIPGSPGAYERTWEATDSLGRSRECVQILETDSSVFALECPPDAFYERGGSFSPDVTGYPTRGGSVCDSTVVEHEDILNDCAGAYTRIWRIIDAFGEEGQACIQIVEPEAIQIACPPDVTVPCGSSAPTSIAGEASLPGSPPGVGLDHEDETENDCPGSFYRTWFATGDSCNIWSCQQLIEYEPEE